MQKNITPVCIEMMRGEALEKIRPHIGSFDQKYCSLMVESEFYKPLMEEGQDWATYRDLQKIFDEPQMKEQGFNASNTLLIDSESEKVQLWLENSLILDPYTKEDVCFQPNLRSKDNEVRTDKWQESYMKEVGDYVVSLLDCADTVPTYL